MSIPTFLVELDIEPAGDKEVAKAKPTKSTRRPRKQLELRRVPGYVKSVDSNDQPETLPIPDSSISSDKEINTTLVKSVEPQQSVAPIPTPVDSNGEMVQLPPLKVGQQHESFMSATPSMSKSGCAMTMADDLVAKLRRTEQYRIASKEKKMEEKMLISEGLGDPYAGPLSIIEAEVLKHVMLREQLVEDLRNLLEVMPLQPVESKAYTEQVDKLECLVAFLRAANIELLESIAIWRRMARKEGKEEKFFMYKGENYLNKVVVDAQEIESLLVQRNYSFFGVFLIPEDGSEMALPRGLLARCEAGNRMLSREEALERRTIAKYESKIRNNLEYIDPAASLEAQENMELAVSNLQYQSQELNLSQELRRRQQDANKLSKSVRSASKQSIEPSGSVFLTEAPKPVTLSTLVVNPLAGGKGDLSTLMRGGVLQTDEDWADGHVELSTGKLYTDKVSSSLSDTGLPVQTSESFDPDDNTNRVTQNHLEKINHDNTVTAEGAGSVGSSSQPPKPFLTVEPQELLARATQDTLHFFRGIIFEVQTRLAVSEELLASKRIQAMARGGRARRLAERKKEEKEQNKAAKLIQRLHRRRSAHTNKAKGEEEKGVSARSAAILIQSITRGRKARNHVTLLFNPVTNSEVFECTRIARFSAQDAANTYNRIAEQLGPPRRRPEIIEDT